MQVTWNNTTLIIPCAFLLWNKFILHLQWLFLFTLLWKFNVLFECRKQTHFAQRILKEIWSDIILLIPLMVQCGFYICSAAFLSSMLQCWGHIVLDEYEKVPSKQEALLYESEPLASILFDRSISRRAHSHDSSSSLMSTVRISSVRRKVFCGEWEDLRPWCPSVPIVKDISLFLTAQSISLLHGEGAFLSLSQQVIALAAIPAERQALRSS